MRPHAILHALALALALSGPAAAQAGPEAPRIVSTVKDLRFVPLADLPRAPARPRRSPEESCSGWAETPRSEATRAVAARGWTVTGEVPLGRYRAISFASTLETGPSGTCYVADGNVGVFDGGRLVALAYGAVPNKIGRVVTRTGGGVRLHDGDALASPIGDLNLRPDGTLALEPLAKVESVCGGRGSVPNIRGLPIDKARAALIAAGWAPVSSEPSQGAEDVRVGREEDLARRGLIEVDGCAGTGLGYCSFKYSGPAGTLSVTTVGDAYMPEVDDYDVECR